MLPRVPAKVVWLFAREDESIARELLRMAAVLESQGLVKRRQRTVEEEAEVTERVGSTDVVMVLASNTMFDGGLPAMVSVAHALNHALMRGGARVVPVLLTSKLPP